MKLLALFPLVALLLSSPSFAAPTLAGDYQCDGCHGYLTIKTNSTGDYKVRLVVGAGSCGGEEFAKGDHVAAKSNKLLLTWKNKKKSCVTEITIDGDEASVQDSCIKPEDEEGSTCAVLGNYSKNNPGK